LGIYPIMGLKEHCPSDAYHCGIEQSGSYHLAFRIFTLESLKVILLVYFFVWLPKFSSKLELVVRRH